MFTIITIKLINFSGVKYPALDLKCHLLQDFFNKYEV